MEPVRKPEVIDLADYRKARKAQAKPDPAPEGEPLLGQRPRAGLILVLAIAVMVVMALISGPR